MNSTTIKVPTDSLPSIVSMLTDEITRLNDLLKTKNEKLSNTQYRNSELSNQVDALKAENKRLYGMLEHADERIGVNQDDF